MKASRFLVAAALAAVSIADVVLLRAYLDASAYAKSTAADLVAAKAKIHLHRCPVSMTLEVPEFPMANLVWPPPAVDPALRGREVSGG